MVYSNISMQESIPIITSEDWCRWCMCYVKYKKDKILNLGAVFERTD